MRFLHTDFGNMEYDFGPGKLVRYTVGGIMLLVEHFPRYAIPYPGMQGMIVPL